LIGRLLALEEAAELLEDDELEACGGGKPHPDGHEAAVEAGGALGLEDLDHAVAGAAVDFGVRRLVHEAGADHVEGRHGASHEKAGRKGRRELSGQAGRNHAALGDQVLDLVVARHFGAVEDHGAGHVGLEATIEASHALLLEEGLGALHHRRLHVAFGGHHAGLQHVEWVAGY